LYAIRNSANEFIGRTRLLQGLFQLSPVEVLVFARAFRYFRRGFTRSYWASIT